MFKFLPKNERFCPVCHHDLEFDSIDYRFNGCQDEFYLCTSCSYALVVRVRFGKIWRKDTFIRKESNEDD